MQAQGTAHLVIPPVMYLPAIAGTGSNGEPVEIEMRRLLDGRVALLAYTALDRLADCCGSEQPWVLYKTDQLDELNKVSPYDVIVIDQPLPDELRRDAK